MQQLHNRSVVINWTFRNEINPSNDAGHSQNLLSRIQNLSNLLHGQLEVFNTLVVVVQRLTTSAKLCTSSIPSGFTTQSNTPGYLVMPASRYAYLISKFVASILSVKNNTLTKQTSRRLDPIFALFVGVSAAGVRIRKDEQIKGRSSKDTIDALKRRTRLATKTFGLGG